MSSSDPESVRSLGLDIGERRIGVAFSRGWLASAYAAIERTADVRAVLDRLTAVIRDEKIGRVVYGIPFNAEGETGIQAEKILTFVRQLEERVPDVEFVGRNEGLTSWQAERTIAGSVKKKNRKQVVDRVAAVLILQGYLDTIQRRLS
jgi:putative Holliday junction resolvase